MKTITFYDWLVSQKMTFNTANKYKNLALKFEQWADNQEIISKKITYPELLNFVDECKKQGNASRTIQLKIAVLRKYFEFIKHKNNPAQELTIKGVTRIIPTNLLSQIQLDNLYKNYQENGLSGKRNKIILSMIIYQCVAIKELNVIEVTDVDLEKGTIYIPACGRSNSRTMQLKPFQILQIQDYLLKIRPAILGLFPRETNYLFVSLGSGKSLQNATSILLPKIKQHEPLLTGFKQIKSSIITIWIGKYGLRKTQYFCGHKYVSSTERYKTTHLEEMKIQLDELHPF